MSVKKKDRYIYLRKKSYDFGKICNQTIIKIITHEGEIGVDSWDHKKQYQHSLQRNFYVESKEEK